MFIAMKVFIEQSGEKNQKNVFDKKTGGFLKTVEIDVTYPYPYGYILNTLAADGDELDCYVITNQKLERAGVFECEPIGMVEWFEEGEEDHKILAVLQGDSHEVTAEVEEKITNFAEHFFDNQPDKMKALGRFLGVEDALKFIALTRKA